MYHFVYKTTNLINKHSSENLNDDYLGSGIALGRAILKYGKDSFKREILEHFNSSDEAYLYESKLVTQSIVDDPLYYNMRFGGSGGGMKFSDETKAKMSDSAKERIKRDGHTLAGKERTAESKRKLSETNKLRYAEDPTCHGRYGTVHSAESKARMSESAKNRNRSKEELERVGKLVKGSTWWNNGTINKRVKAGEQPPTGFVKGRLRHV